LKSFLAERHCCHPKLEAKQIINQQHNPETIHKIRQVVVHQQTFFKIQRIINDMLKYKPSKKINTT
jgi:hypothetical protein